MWWLIPIILKCGKLRQKDYTFQPSLNFLVSKDQKRKGKGKRMHGVALEEN